MSNLVQFVRAEWERTALTIAWGLVVVALAAWGWWLLQEDRPVLNPPPPAASVPVLNRDTAFAFLAERGGPDLRGLNLFTCPIPAGRLLPKPAPLPVAIPDAPPPAVVPVAAPITAAPGIPPAVPVPPPAVAKPPVRPTRVFQYQGCLTTPSGVSLAFLRDCTGQKAVYARAGQTLGGVKVKTFDGQHLILTDATGTEREIRFGAQGEVTSE